MTGSVGFFLLLIRITGLEKRAFQKEESLVPFPELGSRLVRTIAADLWISLARLSSHLGRCPDREQIDL